MKAIINTQIFTEATGLAAATRQAHQVDRALLNLYGRPRNMRFTKTLASGTADTDIDIFLDGHPDRRLNIPQGVAGVVTDEADGEFGSIVVVNNDATNAQKYKIAVEWIRDV